MILGQGFLKKIVVVILIVVCFVLICSPIFAAVPQENPDTAAVAFSGVSLFQFYSGTLDSVLAKNQQDIETDIQVSPFANVPPAVEDSFNNFLSKSTKFLPVNDCSQNKPCPKYSWKTFMGKFPEFSLTIAVKFLGRKIPSACPFNPNF